VRRVLVTGATGLVGRAALPALAALGFEVVGLARRPPAASPFRHVQADLFDTPRLPALLAGIAPTHILHCAWEVTHGQFWTAPENLDHVGATLALARAAGPVRFVGLGSSAEYDWTGGPHPRAEDAPCAPATLYGLAKDATRRLLAAHRPAGFAWARLFHIFGPGEQPGRLVPAIAAALRAGSGYTVRHGLMRADYLATPDLGTALAALVASAVEGPVNIGSGEATALGDLAQLIAARVGGAALLRVEPGAPAAMIPDLTRLRREVGVPTPPPLAQRLAEALAG
jgi:nucleoside-diphosphate-sugar epimerase